MNDISLPTPDDRCDAVRVGIVSISDRASSGTYEDKGLPALRDRAGDVGLGRGALQFEPGHGAKCQRARQPHRDARFTRGIHVCRLRRV